MTDIDSLSATLGRHYVLASDGSCVPSRGRGGWACVKQLREGANMLQDATLRGAPPPARTTAWNSPLP